MKVGILIHEDVEVLDFCGPFEVLSVTRRSVEDYENMATTTSPFEVMLIAKTMTPIKTIGGMQVLPHVSFETCPQLDMLVVPGGLGSRSARLDPETLEFVKVQAKQVKVLASVCSGALVLAQAGLLDDREATTHWTALDLMAHEYPAVKVNRTNHWVQPQDGENQYALWTSAGISAGIDMTLKIVESLHGLDIAQLTAKYMEYPYPVSNHRRVEM